MKYKIKRFSNNVITIRKPNIELKKEKQEYNEIKNEVKQEIAPGSSYDYSNKEYNKYEDPNYTYTDAIMDGAVEGAIEGCAIVGLASLLA